MRIAGGKLVCKGGAEAFTGIGLMPNVIGPGSPAAGIAMKIADGDARGLALHGVALEVLRQLGVLSAAELEALGVFGPCLPRYNWRRVTVGQSYPKFQLHFAGNGRK
jgi:L-asparaginase II